MFIISQNKEAMCELNNIEIVSSSPTRSWISVNGQFFGTYTNIEAAQKVIREVRDAILREYKIYDMEG